MMRLGMGLALGASAIGAPMAIQQPAPAEPFVRPNVIIIETDDMRMDDLQAMPNTRELLGGTNGARYTNSYVSTPLCCPSRASLLTGQYGHNIGVYDNLGSNGGVGAFDDSSTLATWLNPTYQTVMVGKYMNEFGSGAADGTPPGYVPPGWDYFTATTGDGMGNYTDFDVNTNGTVSHVTDRYQTTFFGNRMVDQVATRIGGDPLFMWASFHAPHAGGGDGPDTYVPLTRQYRGSSQVGLPSSPAVNERIVSDKPPWVRALPRLTQTQLDGIVTHRRERRDALMYVDDQVAQIVGAVEAAGELDNTVFMFTSDNGFMLGEHRIAEDKTLPYMEAARVPLLIRGPGFTPGVHAEPVSNVDIAPTVAAVAGVTPGHSVDGMSLLDPVPADRPILLEYLGDDDGHPYSSVIQNRSQYTEYDGDKELYDLAADPWQLQNRVGDTTLRSDRRTLAAELDRLRNCAGEECLP